MGCICIAFWATPFMQFINELLLKYVGNAMNYRLDKLILYAQN